jgi:diguanylate cyclase (GGDEF)-like protein
VRADAGRSDIQQALDRYRAIYLDAMPLAAAIMVIRHGVLEIEDHNPLFLALDKIDPEQRGRPMIARSDFGDRLRGFLASGDDHADFRWDDGDEIAGQQFDVRLTRLDPFRDEEARGIVTLIDRTAERHAQKSLRLEMTHDALTGLPNRAGFNERIEELIAGGEEACDHAVLIVDVRRFSRINESIGPLAGDELLITVARRLMSALRAGDLIARTGGNEFGLLIRLTEGIADAERIATRIANIFLSPCRLSELEIRIDSAIGCALFDRNADAAEIVRRAQFAVKAAKASGEFEIYQPSASRIARQRFTMETRLRRAIDRDQLTLAFQPVIDLATGDVAGFEALARWIDEGVEIPPTQFIPVAEESGLIRPLGHWALNQALYTLAAWDAAHGSRLRVSMAVNISPIQIFSDDVPAMVSAALDTVGMGGERLMLELTESAIIAEPDRAARTLNALKELRATIAMDDFGTGFSNLAALQRLPIDMLKIDRSFVSGMLADRDKAAIVRAILSLARALGMETTAEGIETFELSQLLGALGCSRAQGFFYSRALAADEAYDYWRGLSA